MKNETTTENTARTTLIALVLLIAFALAAAVVALGADHMLAALTPYPDNAVAAPLPAR